MKDSYNNYSREIGRLAKLLRDAGVPYGMKILWDGFQINYPSNNLSISDVVCHEYSYGSELGLLEQMGLTDDAENDDVVGYLTADQVFQCWSEHWKQNHSTLCP